MECLERFNRKMRLGGGTLRGENVLNARGLLAEAFADDPSFAEGVYFWNPGIDPEAGDASYEGMEPLRIRINGRAFSNANGATAKFQTPADSPVLAGDVLYRSGSGEYFICTESFDVDGVHWDGKLTLCNWILKWQDAAGDVLKYPCIDINSTQYNSGETAARGGVFTVGTSQHMVTLPYDGNTVRIDTPQRFYLDRNTENPTAFVASQNDTTSYGYGSKGLVRVTLTEFAGDHDADRPDLGICDYVDAEGLRKDNAGGGRASRSVISYDTAVIRSGGDPQEFAGRFYDEGGREVAGIVPKWDITCGFRDALDVRESGNTITIGVDDDGCVDEEFRLTLSDGGGRYPSSLIVRVESLL